MALKSAVAGLGLAILMTASAAAADSPLMADRVVIEKGSRTLRLYAGERLLAFFKVALGHEPVGRKLCAGDNRTPEGRYQVEGRKLNSDYHLALKISYPSQEDLVRARLWGCDPGGEIMIHGLKEDWGPRLNRLHRRSDWTHGCVAVTNEEIEQIWSMVPDGATVEIRP
jgi:murein L,D-transpeptidase YafK